ncbi:MAG: TonB-dependent receptor, partial [Alistipes sp.]|nr:TonB-dependent receptor [Alistipes sp.]
MKKLLLLVFSTVTFCVAQAQVTTSSISGNVTDGKGAPLVGATVIATHVPSGTQYGAVADVKGNYRLYNVRPGGPYTISFSMVGYQPVEKTGIQLALAENNVTDAYLNEDTIGLEAVVVSADGKNSSMNSDRAGAVLNVDRETMNLMPTVSRSMNDIMRLSPQSNTTSNGFAVGGGNYRQSYVTVDGAAFNNAFGIGSNLPAGGSPISLDALEQISVAITPYDVRQSGFTGGAINAVTRSGDNEFRGSFYTYLTNNNLKGIHVGDFDLTRSKSSEYTYGVTLGGPIVKNKLFFFVNAEYQDETIGGMTRQARPNEDEGWGSGTNYNRPLASDMEMISNFVKDRYGYSTGPYTGYDVSAPDYKIMARLDWNINDNNTLNLRVSHTHN